MSKMLHIAEKLILLGFLMGLGSCSVYAPLQPGAPMLRDKGEAEVGGNVYLSGRFEGSAAYSPVRHVLVRAAGGIRTDKRTDTYFRTRQLEVGAGTYWPLSERWLVGGMGGYGWGRGSRGFYDGGYSTYDSVRISYNYRARYGKVFGETFIAFEDGPITYGLAYRLSQVRFSSLTNNGLPINLRRMTRNEPMFFMRFGSKQGVLQWAQLQLALSTSWSADLKQAAPVSREFDDVKEARLFTTIGLVVYPHRFKRVRY